MTPCPECNDGCTVPQEEHANATDLLADSTHWQWRLKERGESPQTCECGCTFDRDEQKRSA